MNGKNDMMSDKFFFICSVLLNLTGYSFTADGNYYVSKTSSTWNDMEHVCPVGVPTFKFTSSEYVVQLDNISHTDYNGVWVGYWEILESFSYIGCLNNDQASTNSDAKSSATKLAGSPGQCFRECGYGTYFGLMNLKCFCFRENPVYLYASLSNSSCSRTCEFQPGVACGGAESISVYKFNSHARENLTGQDKKSNQTEMFCLKANTINLQYIWANCMDSLAIACDFDGSYILTTSPPTIKPWIHSAEECFSKNASLITISDNLSLNQKTNSGMWTSIIRSPVIYKYKDLKHRAWNKAVVIRYGVLTRKKNRYILTFMKRTSHRKVLCLKDSNELLLVEIVVGLSVTLGVLIAAVVTIVILKISRKLKEEKTKDPIPSHMSGKNCPVYNLPTLPTHSQDLPSSDHYVSIDIEFEKEDHHEEVMSETASDPAPVHNYFVLEKLKRDDNDLTSTTSWLIQNQARENTAKKGIDETFATSNLGTNKIGMVEKAYDKCYTSRGNSYDHICISDNKVSWIADKTYDNTSNIKIK